MHGKTNQIGTKTHLHTRFSPLMVANKDPNFDYSFRRLKDVEDGGGSDMYGFEPVSAQNNNGEEYAGPKIFGGKTRGAKQIRNQDTVLCKRPLEVAKWFKAQEDEKYNAQVKYVSGFAKNARAELRRIDPNAVIVDKSTASKGAFTQRPGSTETEE